MDNRTAASDKAAALDTHIPVEPDSSAARNTAALAQDVELKSLDTIVRQALDTTVVDNSVENSAVVEQEIVDLAHTQFVVVAVAFTSPHKTSSPQLRSRREYLQ